MKLEGIERVERIKNCTIKKSVFQTNKKYKNQRQKEKINYLTT